MKIDRKEYNRIMTLLVESHKANHPSIKRFRLQSAIEAACALYRIPKKDFVDVWLDFFEHHKSETLPAQSQSQEMKPHEHHPAQ